MLTSHNQWSYSFLTAQSKRSLTSIKYTPTINNMYTLSSENFSLYLTRPTVPGTSYPKYTTLNIWAPSRAMALESRRRSRSLLALPKEELRSAGGAEGSARFQEPFTRNHLPKIHRRIENAAFLIPGVVIPFSYSRFL